MKTRSDDLQLLLAVIDSGSFSAAAERLDLQVARVSRAVSRIEQQLGQTLLNRTTRRFDLTEEGQRFVAKVREGLALLDQAEEALNDREPSGRVRLDAASPFVLHQLVPLVTEFRQRFPKIELELTSHEGFVDLLEQRIDVAIRIGALKDSRLHARPMGRSPLHLVASPEYLERHGAPTQPEQLAAHELIGFSGTPRLNQWPLDGIGPIRPALAASSGEVVRQLALAGNGIACLSRFMVREDLEQGRLTSVLADLQQPDPDREQVNAVYYRTAGLPQRITTLLDFLTPRLTL